MAFDEFPAGYTDEEIFEVVKDEPPETMVDPAAAAKEDYLGGLHAPNWSAREIPSKTYFLGHFLHSSAKVLLTGDTGIGKSLLALEMACCGAAGKPFLHWPAGEAHTALFVDGEMGAEEIKDRLADLERRRGSLPQNLIVLSCDDLEPVGEMLGAPYAPLDTPEGQAWLLAVIEYFNPQSLWLDNIMCLTAGQVTEETWKSTQDLRAKIQARKIAQVWLHHTGHDVTRGYGTRSLAWQMTACIHLAKNKSDALVAIDATFPKVRGRRSEWLKEFEPKTLTFDGATWSSGEPQAAAAQPQLGSRQQQWLDALHNAVTDHGRPLPRSKNYPTRNGIRVDEWREMGRSMGLLDGCKDEQSAGAFFRKYKGNLMDKGLVREFEGWIWLP